MHPGEHLQWNCYGMQLKLWTAKPTEIQDGALPTTYLLAAQQFRELAQFMRVYEVGDVEWMFKADAKAGIIYRGIFKFLDRKPDFGRDTCPF